MQMKKYHEKNPHLATFAPLDHRSEAFRQKMCKHFQSNPQVHWRNIENMPECNRSKGVILFKEPLANL
jgi:hypothetical protein